MNDLIVKEVPFNGAMLTAIQNKENGKIYAGVKWICKGVGLSDGQYQNETRKIQGELVLKQGIANLHLPTKGGKQEVLCMELDFLPLWLAKISITPKMQEEQPELTERLVEYQLKAKDALAAAFIKKQKAQSEDKTLDREIRLKNARVREASILLKVANASDTEQIYRGILKAKAIEIVSGERLLPYPTVTEKTYTATQIAEMYNISSANMVGRICNKLSLKAPEGESNEYGHWIHDKSASSVKEVKTWVYTDLGAQHIGDYVKKQAV